MSAAMTPGTQPMRVSRNTINTDPQPRSITAKGGKIIANSTCKQLISLICLTFAHNLCAKLLLFFHIRKKKRLLVAFFSFRLSLPCVFSPPACVFFLFYHASFFLLWLASFFIPRLSFSPQKDATLISFFALSFFSMRLFRHKRKFFHKKRRKLLCISKICSTFGRRK